MKITESLLRQFARQILLELRDAGGEGPPREDKYFARPVGSGYVIYYAVGSGGGPKAIPGTIGYYYQSTYVEGAAGHAGDSFSLSPEGLEQLEKLVDMGLYQKKEQEVEYPDITFKYRKDAIEGSPASKWKQESDVPATKTVYEPINPGFEFLLVDTGAKLVSLDSSWSERRPRRGGGTPGGANQSGKNKSYVMPSGDVGFVGATLSLQKLLKHLMQVDPRVTADYKVVSPDDKFRGKTIGDVAGAKRTTDVALGTAPGPLIAYHGTSTKRWPAIEKGGMKPGKFETPYSDQIPGYSEGNLYFTTDPHTAENYATRAGIWDKSTPLILKVEIPDFTRIVPDEDSMGWFKLSRPYTLTDSSGDTETLEDELHMSRAMRLVQQGGTEVKADSEFVALRREIEGQINSYLTKSVGSGLFAYRGPILPKFISRWKEYPLKSYPRSVDTGSDEGDAYDSTRQGVLKKVKRFEESDLRRLIHMALLEAGRLSGSPSSGVRTFFSAGGETSREFTTPDELLSLLLTSEARHTRVSLLVPDPDSYSEDPALFEVGGVSFKVLEAPPAGWESMWWWPLPAEDARPDSNSVRAPRYHSMLDAATVSLRERLGESLHIFGAGPGLPGVKIQVGEVWEDGAYLPTGFTRKWWTRFINGLKPKRAPVEWLGSDDPMVR